MHRIWSLPSGDDIPGPVLDSDLDGIPSECGFVALHAAYRSSGGIACGDDLARLLEDHRCGDFVSLQRLFNSHEIFGFEWRDTVWVPMFQFDLGDLSSNREARQVRDELAGESGGWTLASWFARRNPLLNDARPVELLDSNLAAVLEAARADRALVPNDHDASLPRWQRRSMRAEDRRLLEGTATWLDSLPKGARPLQLPTRFARIANELSFVWADIAALGRFFDDKRIDLRGGRQGFSPIIQEELLALHLFSLRRRQHLRPVPEG